MSLWSCLSFRSRRKGSDSILFTTFASWPSFRRHLGVSPLLVQSMSVPTNPCRTAPPPAHHKPSLHPDEPPPDYEAATRDDPPTELPLTGREGASGCSKLLQDHASAPRPSAASRSGGKTSDRPVDKRNRMPSWEVETRRKVAEIGSIGTSLREVNDEIGSGSHASQPGCENPYTERNTRESSLYQAERGLYSTLCDAQSAGCSWARIATILRDGGADASVQKTFGSVWKAARPRTSRPEGSRRTAVAPTIPEPSALAPPSSLVTMKGFSPRGIPFEVTFDWTNRTGFE
jgi:hypothetical protein